MVDNYICTGAACVVPGTQSLVAGTEPSWGLVCVVVAPHSDHRTSKA